MSSSPRWPKLNLPKVNVTELRIYSEHPLESEFAKTLLAHSNYDNEFISGTPYKRESTQHLIIARATYSDRIDDSLMVRVHYLAGNHLDGMSVPKSDRQESVFATIYQQFAETIDVGFAAEFEFNDRTDQDLWFPLPTNVVGELTSNEVFEIRGVSGVRRQLEQPEGESDYLFSLNRPFNKDVLLEIRFMQARQIDLSLPNFALKEACRFAQDLVRQQGGAR